MKKKTGEVRYLNRGIEILAPGIPEGLDTPLAGVFPKLWADPKPSGALEDVNPKALLAIELVQTWVLVPAEDARDPDGSIEALSLTRSWGDHAHFCDVTSP